MKLEDSVTKLQQNLNSSRRYELPEIDGFRRKRLKPHQCTDLYEAGGVASRWVNRLAGDCTRKGFTLKGPDDAGVDWDVLNSALEDYRIPGLLGKHIRWSQVYGGSGLLAAVNDGRKTDQPLNLENVSGIISFQAIPSPMLLPDLSKMSRGIGSRSYLSPTHYQLQRPEDVGVHITAGKAIHHTRLHRLDASVMSPLSLANSSGWGPSAFEQIIVSLERLLASYGHTAEIMRTASMIVMRMKDFRTLAASEDRDKLDEAITSIARNMSAFNLLAFDKDDEFFELKRTLTDMAGVLEIYQEALISDTGGPREILFGLTENGLNSGENSGAFRNWYDQCAEYQNEYLTPALNFLLEVIFANRRFRGLPAPETWTVCWNPLYEMSELEKEQLRKTASEADAIQHAIGQVTSEEIRKSRNEQGKIGGPIEVEPEVVEADGPDGEAAGTEPVSNQALNGAQIASLVAIVEKVQLGQIPRDAAIGVIGAAFPAYAAQAETLLGSAGLQVPAAPGGTPAPLGPDGQPLATDVEPAEPEPVQADYEPPDGEVPLSAQEIAARAGVSAGVIKGLHRRGKIGGWKVGSRWRYLLSEVLKTSHRPAAGPGDEG